MTEIKRNTREVSNVKIETYSKEIVSACMLGVEVGTNGYQGGDTGHGSRTYISFKNEGCTDMNVHVGYEYDTPNKVTLTFGGDCELMNIILALKFAINVLEDQIKGDIN